MNPELQWYDVALRLTLTVIAGGLIGLDRGEHGRPAGLRTTILVCLASSVSMILVNILLGMQGKAGDSFVVLDLMRLPLGVLSGMGFIGGGAILKKGNLIIGVTTAATLWFVTVMGLCIGGGQIWLGLSMCGIGLAVLSGLRLGERRLTQDRRAILRMTIDDGGPTENEIRSSLLASRFEILSFAVSYSALRIQRIRCQVLWRARLDDSETPEVIVALAKLPGVIRVKWLP